MSAVLLARDLTKTYVDRQVLKGVSLTAPPGRRIGLVGENGVGKTTLLRLLAGLEQPDSGEVHRPEDVGFLPQEPSFSPRETLADVLDRALDEYRQADKQLRELSEVLAEHPDDAEALADYGRVLEWAEQHALWDVDHRADEVLAGLGLSEIQRSRPIGTLSGGQRSRLALALLLLRQPQVLLLDEPTNHLDEKAAEFLQQHLVHLPGAVVLASHDRVFLDEVCTGILDLDPALDGPTYYGGAFSDYLQQKRAERARWEQRYAEEQAELAQLRHSVRVTARQVSHHAPRGNTSKLAYDYKGGRVQKQISRRVRNAQRRLDELSKQQVRKPPKPLRFAASLSSAGSTDLVVQVRHAAVERRVRVEHLDIAGDTRLLITGANGAGKSTLLQLLAGRLTPDAGTVQRRGNARVGLLEQDVVFPDPHRTPRQVYASATAGLRHEVVPLVELGLIAPADVDRPLGVLSVGQRRRLALALLVASPPHLLLLDEPTNHISLSLVGELEEALQTAPGAVVVASHDRWLRRRWQDPRLHLAAGRVVGREE